MPQCNEQQTFGKAGEYVKKVCEQIRWGRAHKVISEELLNHIEDQKEAFIKKGQNQQEAERNAVLEMGDAVTVGQQLDRTHRPKPDWGIIGVMCVCILMGLIIQFITSHSASLDSGYIYASVFKNYLLSLPVGITIFLLMYFIVDYTLIVRSPIFNFSLMMILCYAMIASNSMAAYGTHQHILYIALVTCPIYAAIVYNYRNQGYMALIKLGIIAVAALLIFAYGGGYMSCFMFALSGIIIISVAVHKGWFSVKKWKALLLVYVPSLAVLAYCFFGRQSYLSVSGRGIILPFSNLFHQQEGAYSYIMFIIGDYLKNSNLWGKGASVLLNPSNPAAENAIEKVLPCWGSDYSLVYITYKFGYVCAAMLIAVVTVLLIRMLHTTSRQTSQLGFIVCLSVTTEVFIQSACYILSNLGVMTAIAGPLPLITYGKMSFIVNMYLMGLFLSANRRKSIVSDKKIIKPGSWTKFLPKKKKSTGGDNYAGI